MILLILELIHANLIYDQFRLIARISYLVNVLILVTARSINTASTQLQHHIANSHAINFPILQIYAVLILEKKITMK